MFVGRTANRNGKGLPTTLLPQSQRKGDTLWLEEIQIFPEKTEDGRIIKRIKLCVPVVYENENTPKISWDKLTPVESIVCLTKEETP